MLQLQSTRLHSFATRKKTQNAVASVAQVTEVTIRNRYQEQIAAMGIHD